MKSLLLLKERITWPKRTVLRNSMGGSGSGSGGVGGVGGLSGLVGVVGFDGVDGVDGVFGLSGVWLFLPPQEKKTGSTRSAAIRIL